MLSAFDKYIKIKKMFFYLFNSVKSLVANVFLDN